VTGRAARRKKEKDGETGRNREGGSTWGPGRGRDGKEQRVGKGREGEGEQFSNGQVVYDIVKGLSVLHSHKPKIIHRDLRSPNIFVCELFHVCFKKKILFFFLGRTLVNSPRWCFFKQIYIFL
jgi:hypothetical protein